MKNIHKFSFAVLLAALSFGLFSCSKQEISSNSGTDNQSDKIEVSLACSGEIINLGTSPLSRAGENDLYHVAIFEMIEDGEYTNIQSYAYGMFNSIDNIKVSFL